MKQAHAQRRARNIGLAALAAAVGLMVAACSENQEESASTCEFTHEASDGSVVAFRAERADDEWSYRIGRPPISDSTAGATSSIGWYAAYRLDDSALVVTNISDAQIETELSVFAALTPMCEDSDAIVYTREVVPGAEDYPILRLGDSFPPEISRVDLRVWKAVEPGEVRMGSVMVGS